MKKAFLFYSFFLLIFIAGCSSEDRWGGYVYPDRTNLLVHLSSGEFGSLKDCESASMDMLKSMKALEKGYYECGKNCESNGAFVSSDCEEIIRGNFYK